MGFGGKNELFLREIEKKMEMENKRWLTAFFDIPAEFRVNPFDVSPSGDLFFADKRNLDAIDEGLASGEGKVYSMQEIKRLLGL
jgi:hypothetical protein